jgi:23S rRNA (guanosine2251-2'-O)-methyltransferase
MARNERFIFGVHPVLEAAQAGRNLEKVFVRRDAGSDLIRKLMVVLHSLEIPVQRVPLEKLNRITGKNHQGVIAVLSDIPFQDITTLLPSVYERGEEPLILLLDNVSDVRNFGAIARSAECAGVHAIVIPASGSAAVNADAIKTSAGALHRIAVCRHRDLLTAARFLKDSGLRLFAATEKADASLYESDLTGPAAVIVGSEDKGISPPLLSLADCRASIPMKGIISSLNVSVAAGVFLFELVRQRDAATRAGSDG